MLRLIQENVAEQPDTVAVESSTIDTEDINPAASADIPTPVVEAATAELIQDLIQGMWGQIAQTNATIATFELELQSEYKEEIIELLNSLIDDETIAIGVLNKISSLLNTRRAELVASGEEKAEAAIENM